MEKKENQSGVFDFKIQSERERFLNSESCKMLRNTYKLRIEKRWGIVDNWKENACDCKAKCKRKKTIEHFESREKARQSFL